MANIKRTSYNKDKKITILRPPDPELDVDEMGQPLDDWQPLEGATNIWAYYRQTSGKEFYAAMQVNTRVDAIFKIGWRNNIDETMRVLFRGKEYNITRIDDYEGYKKDLTIYAYINS